MTDIQGLHAPFLISWLGVWLFAFLGGLSSGFVKIRDIDERLFLPFIAKPLIGTVAGVAVAVYLNADNDPPSATLISWAFVGAMFLTPVITGLLVFISDQKRQNEIYTQVKDKYLPFGKGGEHDDSR